MKNLIFVLASLGLASCAFHTGNVSTGGTIDCPLVVRTEGHAKTMHAFGIGGLDKEALINEAKNDLYANCRLRKGVHVSNFAVDFKTSYLLFVMIQKATVTADVFDCNASFPADTATPYTFRFFTERKNGFKVGDSIVEAPFMTKGILINLHEGSGLTMQSKKSKNNISTNMIVFRSNNIGNIKQYNNDLYNTGIAYDNVFKITPEPENPFLFGYEIGETFFIQNRTTQKKELCKIIGLNKTKLLVEKRNDKGAVYQEVVNKIDFKIQ